MAVEPVFGIEGRGDGRLMFERSEANIDYQTSSSYLSGVSPLVEDGMRHLHVKLKVHSGMHGKRSLRQVFLHKRWCSCQLAHLRKPSTPTQQRLTL